MIRAWPAPVRRLRTTGRARAAGRSSASGGAGAPGRAGPGCRAPRRHGTPDVPRPPARPEQACQWPGAGCRAGGWPTTMWPPPTTSWSRRTSRPARRWPGGARAARAGRWRSPRRARWRRRPIPWSVNPCPVPPQAGPGGRRHK